MIFPSSCKQVGMASTHPCGEKVYFLSRYLIHECGEGHEIISVLLKPEGQGLMRELGAHQVIAEPCETWWYPEKVQIHNRALLVRLAAESGKRCTIFTGLDEHTTFVIDPDPALFQTIHVYDVTPPRPSLSAAISDLEEAGMFGELEVSFEHSLHDLSGLDAEVYPCRASGFIRTLDADPLQGGEKVAGCLSGSQLIRECYGDDFELVEICPLRKVREEPFIARCCRKEREGLGIYNGMFGTVVHWGAAPPDIYRAVIELMNAWRRKDAGCSC